MTTLAELGVISKAKAKDDEKHRSGRYWAAGGVGGMAGGMGAQMLADRYGPNKMEAVAYRSNKNAYFDKPGGASEHAADYHEPKKGTFWHSEASKFKYGDPEYKAEKIHLNNALKKHPGKYGRRAALAATLFYGGAGALAASPVIGGVNMARNRKQEKRG